MNADILLKDAATEDGLGVQQELVIGELETLRALTDRHRLQIMESFARYGGKPRTVKDVARELGQAPTKLYYHVNLLEQHGLLVVAGSRLVSGIVEKRYRPAAREFRVDKELLRAASTAGDAAGDDVRRALATVLDSAADDLRAAMARDTFNYGDGRNLVSRGTLRLTDDQARRLRELLKEIVETADSNDELASDYRLTIAFHPLPEAD